MFLVRVREQRQTIDEAAKGRFRLATLVFASGRDQFRQVFDPAFGVFAALVAQILQVAAAIEDLADGNGHRFLPGHLGERDDEIAEHRERRGCAVREHPIFEAADEASPKRVGRQRGLKARGEQRQILVRRRLDVLDRLHHAFADSAGRCVDHPPQADVVVRIDDQPHVSERVLDFPTLVEPYAPDDFVRDAFPHQRILNRSGLRVRAV